MSARVSATVSPPFTQCPTGGVATSCSYLFVLTPDGTTSTFSDASVPATDGIEDTLVGIMNKTGVSMSSFTVAGSGIGDFDLDGPTAFGNTLQQFKQHLHQRQLELGDSGLYEPLAGNGGTDFFVLEGAPNQVL